MFLVDTVFQTNYNTFQIEQKTPLGPLEGWIVLFVVGETRNRKLYVMYYYIF